MPSPRIARQGAACLVSRRGQARKARVSKFELDEGFQPHHPPFRTAVHPPPPHPAALGGETRGVLQSRARTGAPLQRKGKVLLRGVGTLRYSFPPNASVQWQPDGLTIHARRWFLGGRIPRSTSHFSQASAGADVAPWPWGLGIRQRGVQSEGGAVDRVVLYNKTAYTIM